MSEINPAIGGYTAFMSAQGSSGLIFFRKEEDRTLCLAWDGVSIFKEERTGTKKPRGQVLENADTNSCFACLSNALTDALNNGWELTPHATTTKLKGRSVMDYIDGDTDGKGIGFFFSWEKAAGEIKVPEQLIRTDIGAAVHLKSELHKEATAGPKPLSGTIRLGSDNFFALWRLKKLYPTAVKMMRLDTNEDVALLPQDWRVSHSEVMEEFGLIMGSMKIDESKSKLVPVQFF